MSDKRSPRENVAPLAGLGGFAKDFGPPDREFQEVREKARDVLEGRTKYSMVDLGRIVSRLLIER